MTSRAMNVSILVAVRAGVSIGLLRYCFAPRQALPVWAVLALFFGDPAPFAGADADPQLFRLQMVFNADQAIARTAPAAIPDRLQRGDGGIWHGALLAGFFEVERQQDGEHERFGYAVEHQRLVSPLTHSLDGRFVEQLVHRAQHRDVDDPSLAVNLRFENQDAAD